MTYHQETKTEGKRWVWKKSLPGTDPQNKSRHLQKKQDTKGACCQAEARQKKCIAKQATAKHDKSATTQGEARQWPGNTRLDQATQQQTKLRQGNCKARQLQGKAMRDKQRHGGTTARQGNAKAMPRQRQGEVGRGGSRARHNSGVTMHAKQLSCPALQLSCLNFACPCVV